MPAATRPSWWGGVFPTLVLPLLVAVVSCFSAGGAAYWDISARRPDAWGLALLLAGSFALVGRRAYALATLAVTAAALVTYAGLGYAAGLAPLAFVIALFTAATAGHHRSALVISTVAMTTLAVWLVTTGQQVPWWLLVLGPVLVVVAGVLRRNRRERRDQMRTVIREQERRRWEEESRKVGEERLRIAQELHDVLGHHVSLINVQAGVALFLLDDDPEQARTALAEIKRSSRELLREMRSTLGVLRGVDAEAPHQPTPGLDRLDALLDDVRAAGLPVVVRVEGDERELPTGVDLAAYRIVQESLTNTRRHAGASTATVVLRYGADEVEVTVDDDGAGPPPASGRPQGNGLLGMRERAHAVGGTLEVGPGPERGYRVRARLPLPDRPGTDPGVTAAEPGTVPPPGVTTTAGASGIAPDDAAGSGSAGTGREPGTVRR